MRFAFLCFFYIFNNKKKKRDYEFWLSTHHLEIKNQSLLETTPFFKNKNNKLKQSLNLL